MLVTIAWAIHTFYIMEELSKYFLNTTIQEVKRSEIDFATYNPRTIDEEGRKALKKSIKTYGVVGGIIVNKRNMVIVGGHQKVKILDDLHKYNKGTNENDYTLRVEIGEWDDKTEKTLNVLLNNPNVGGKFDFDKLRDIIPDIDWKIAGLTDADLSMIGMDAIFKSEDEEALADELADMMSAVEEEHRQEVEQRKITREQEKAALKSIMEEEPEKTHEEKTQHMKDVKQQVRDQAIEKASNMEAYFMLSFDNWQNKADFCERFGLDPSAKFIKGEDFENRLDGVLDDE